MPKLKHYYALNLLHYLTSSIPQGDRARLFDSERLGKQWVATFGELRRELELNYLHKNPVKRGPVKHPGDRPWSSCRFYFWNDGSTLGMDKML